MTEIEVVDANYNMYLRTSERTSYARCRQQWFWAYRENLSTTNPKPALVFGDLVHQALAAYYPPSSIKTKARRGPHPAGTFRKLYMEGTAQLQAMGMRMEDEQWTDALSLGIEMMENYVDYYGKDERYVCIKPEVPFKVELYDNEGYYLCTYVGTFDAIIIDLETNRYGLFEHKTAKTVRTAHLTLDEQAGTYWALAPYVLEAKLLPRIDFILYNFLRKGKKDDRPQDEDGYALNKDGTISKRQPSPLFVRETVRRTQANVVRTMTRIASHATEIQMIDDGLLDVTKTPNQDCSWQCQFFDMCELHEAGGDWQGYKQVAMTGWEPYEVHLDHPEAGEREE
jgi:hypothetical protein